MAKFNYYPLVERISNALGYKLYGDFGEVSAADRPRREGNTIINPVIGVCRLAPTPLTTLKSPYIAITAATIELVCPVPMREEVLEKVYEMTDALHSTAEKVKQGDTTYTVVYTMQTPEVDGKRRDVGMYDGEIITIRQVVTMTVVEAGLSSNDMILRIDGIEVPCLTLMETRTAASETTPNANAKGEVAVMQELYGVTLTTPAVENALGEMLESIVNDGNGNKAHAVEVVKFGKSHAHIMTVGTSGTTAQPPNNVGYSLSLAEVSPMAAEYNSLWTEKTLNGLRVTTNVNGVILWGDGTADRANGSISHTYTDGKTTHTAMILSYADTSRWGVIAKGAKLYGVTIKGVSEMVATSNFSGTVLTMDSGDSISVVGSQLKMTVDGSSFAVDAPTTFGYYALQEPFTSLLRGSVATINTSLLLYDRWAVAKEV